MTLTNLVGLTIVVLSTNISPPGVVTNRVRGPGKPPLMKDFRTNHAEFSKAMQLFQATNSSWQVRTNVGSTNYVVGVVSPDGKKIPLRIGR